MAHNASSYSKKDERGWPPMGTLRVSYDEREVWQNENEGKHNPCRVNLKSFHRITICEKLSRNILTLHRAAKYFVNR